MAVNPDKMKNLSHHDEGTQGMFKLELRPSGHYLNNLLKIDLAAT